MSFTATNILYQFLSPAAKDGFFHKLKIGNLREVIRANIRDFNNKTTLKFTSRYPQKNGAGGETNSGAFFYGRKTLRHKQHFNNTNTLLIRYCTYKNYRKPNGILKFFFVKIQKMQYIFPICPTLGFPPQPISNRIPSGRI